MHVDPQYRRAAEDVGSGDGQDTLISIENVNGSAFDDVLIGNGGVNALSGGEGDDTLTGYINGDVLDGGDGDDTADFSGYSGPELTINLGLETVRFGTKELIKILSVENVIGSDAADHIFNGLSSDTINGGGGDDTIEIDTRGVDALFGGDGDDTVIFDADFVPLTTITGGAGNDTVVLTNCNTPVTFLATSLIGVERLDLASCCVRLFAHHE